MLSDALLGRSRAGDALGSLASAVARHTGVPFGVPVARARTGIYLAVKSVVRPGRKVVLSPYTIHEVVNMVICAGGVPVFADIERETCNANPTLCAELIDEETDAVLVTHLHGLAMELDELAEVCRGRGVALIEDAAQSFGTKLHGRPVGGIGDAGVFSFGMYKNLTSFLGGLVVTRDAELFDRIAGEAASYPAQPLRDIVAEALNALTTDVATWPPLFGPLVYPLFRYGYLHDVEWLNKRVRVEDDPRRRSGEPSEYLLGMRDTQARVALAQLGAVESDCAARIEHARRYRDGLSDLDALLLPPFRDDGSHGYGYYPIQCDDRAALLRALVTDGCDLAAQHLKNCADLACFSEWARDCPNARATADATILLPTYPRYGVADVERNIHAIRRFLGRSS